LTACYSLTLVWATHYPKPEDLLGPNPPPDKALHFIAYGLLGLLTAATLAASRHWSRRNAIILAVALALAAVVDESTQPLFGRAAEALDWVFDVVGIVAGVAAVAIARQLLGWSPREPQ
jgi:VanZ family protein